MSLEHLSAAQREAAMHVSSPAIVTAGAGSGKTRTLTSKIAYLVNELAFDPARILAITFTNKAAAEMKNRLRAATGMRPESFPWVRTFHSACFRILKEHCDLLGYRKPLLIHDESQQKTHLKKVLADLDVDRKYLFAASSMISHAKNSGTPLQHVKAQGRIPRKLEIYDQYNEALGRNNSVDFDDILLFTRDLLIRYPELRSRYQELFDYILIDEFQDSNGIQNEVVDLLLRNGNLTVVGDDYQSIYKFRGADPMHFIQFPDKYAGTRIFRLEENYRSTAQIVAASDALISHNAFRLEKHCFSTRQGVPVQVEVFPDEGDEARWVANKCWEFANYKKIPPESIAVLYRTKFTSLPFERSFRSARVPYTMVGAQGFFQRREIQDINAYLVCAVNPADDVSFERIINVPKRGIGPGALQKILAAKPKDESLQEGCRHALQRSFLPKKTAMALEDLLLFIRSLRLERPAVAMERVVQETGYHAYLESIAENSDDLETRRENIREMISDSTSKGSIADYLEDAALLREDQDSSENKAGIRLSTIHAAKGLEFKAVFVVSLEDGILPHQRSMPDQGGDGADDAGIEEERRLMYVAMTRASDHLHLSWCRTRRGQATSRSRFLSEIPDDLVEGLADWATPRAR
jgi:DNA helicase II / ATP-dependent DNA helicase PcrA